MTGSRPIERLGQYRLMEKVGEGAMGVVYRAQDERLGRIVALKLLAEGTPEDRGARGRLLREARAASALNHPNICTIHEIGEGSGQAYLVMEHVEGRTLKERVSRVGLPIGEVIRLGTQIAEALEHAHARGVVHRDLKPGKVRVTPEGRAKVLDFGLAVQQPQELEKATLSRDSLNEASAIAGTLPYMAPEVLRGNAAVEQSDIWSLGVMLYEMAAGGKPFQGKTGFALSAAILNEPPRAFPKGVPAALGEVILRCLEKDPQWRYAKAAEVRAALQALEIDENAWPALEASHLEETPPIPTNRGVLRFGRWVAPWTAAVLIGIGVVLAVGLVWYWPVLTARPGETEPRLVAEPKRLSTGGKPSKKAKANEYFEKARLALLSQSDLIRAQQMYARALELDPHFAEARADFGLIDELLFISGDSDDASLLYKAEEELRRALADDPNCGRAHGVLASIYLNQGRKDLVPQEVHEALGANPNDQDAQLWMLNYFALNGAYDAGEEWARKMLERNPVFWPARIALAEMLRERVDSTGSMLEDQKVLEQDPKNTHALLGLARTYMNAGKLPEARRMLEEVTPGRAKYQTRSMWALLLALEGKRAQARKEMDEKVLKYLGAVPCCTVTGAEFFAVLGQTDLAFDWLDRAVRNGDERAEWFRRDPLLEKLRKHPKFEQILKSIEFRRQQVAKP